MEVEQSGIRKNKKKCAANPGFGSGTLQTEFRDIVSIGNMSSTGVKDTILRS